jgi:helicase
LFDRENIVVSTPTASGKTLVGEMAMRHNAPYGKAVYIVPLRALAAEKHEDFTERHPDLDVTVATGDMDGGGQTLVSADIIIVTSEKLDSLLRHRAPWIDDIRCVVVDEIHLLNDQSRGPTLEVVLTLLRRRLNEAQIVGLSATIGNDDELASWLDAALVDDDWRPVELREGVYEHGRIHFVDTE